MIQANAPIVSRDPAYVPAVEAMFSDRLSQMFLRENGKTRPVGCEEIEARFGVDYLGDVLDNADCQWVEYTAGKYAQPVSQPSRLNPVFEDIFSSCFPALRK